ncbi:MAG: hypothetical protein ACR2PA_07510 [Hyphomicrobiaceae bacterium]
MRNDFFAQTNDQPWDGDIDDWNRWHDQLIITGSELLEMVDTFLASTRDEAKVQLLEMHRDRVVSIMLAARHILREPAAGGTGTKASGKRMQ